MDTPAVASWVERYVRAWKSNAPADVGALFAADARYYQRPDEEPWRGRAGIVAAWLEHKDEPGNWTFRFEVLGTNGDLAFVRGWTRYQDPPAHYGNLWVLRFDTAGKCAEFTEWWMEARSAEPGADSR
ncbi:MAG: nuclear transport factor 2 family protein [Thermomicrobiales bacterium]